MALPMNLHPDRLFPADAATRGLARRLYATVADLPIVSPHGHTDPQWFADDTPFANASALLITPDHYVFRMLYSQGLRLEDLGIPRRDGSAGEQDARKIWHAFAAHYHLFRGTPTRLWLDHAFNTVFGIDERLTAESADRYFDRINECLAQPAFRPRALVRALQHRSHRHDRVAARSAGPSPEDPQVGMDRAAWSPLTGPIRWSIPSSRASRPTRAIRARSPARTRRRGTDISRRTAIAARSSSRWAPRPPTTATRRRARRDLTARRNASGCSTARCPARSRAEEAEAFRGQMLTEMAKMSLDDGLVMQIHPGSFRNHNPLVFREYGRDKGADIPTRTDYVRALKPLLDKFGNERGLTVILFTLDETTYSRELAPLAGHYPVLKLGPSWWFYDSPEGMQRFREQVTETAGFYNTVGFNDDTRAFLSIPARHDVARRMDCRFLATLAVEHKIGEDEAFELAPLLAYGLAKAAYKL